MGYGYLPLAASIILGLHHVLFSDASRLPKLVVSAVVVGSLVIWHSFPTWILLATVLQAAVCIYVLVFNKLHGDQG